eukprot:COSAG01_NODE_12426_length_1741_cov_4.522533_3_plen_113_part_00
MGCSSAAVGPWAAERAARSVERAQARAARDALRESIAHERDALAGQLEGAAAETQLVLRFMARARALRYEDNVPPASEDVEDYMDYLNITGLAAREKLRCGVRCVLLGGCFD